MCDCWFCKLIVHGDSNYLLNDRTNSIDIDLDWEHIRPFVNPDDLRAERTTVTVKRRKIICQNLSV